MLLFAFFFLVEISVVNCFRNLVSDFRGDIEDRGVVAFFLVPHPDSFLGFGEVETGVVVYRLLEDLVAVVSERVLHIEVHSLDILRLGLVDFIVLGHRVVDFADSPLVFVFVAVGDISGVLFDFVFSVALLKGIATGFRAFDFVEQSGLHFGMSLVVGLVATDGNHVAFLIDTGKNVNLFHFSFPFLDAKIGKKFGISKFILPNLLVLEFGLAVSLAALAPFLLAGGFGHSDFEDFRFDNLEHGSS